jgi:hypothetical protein
MNVLTYSPLRALCLQRQRRRGSAAMETVMYFTFFLMPVVFLGWSVMRSGVCMHNAIASARHGAFRRSVSGVANFDDPSGGAATRYDSQDEIERYIAYYPPGQNPALSGQGGGGDVDVTASMFFAAPHKNVIKSRDIVYHGRLIMRKRETNLYDQKKGMQHEIAEAAWDAFNAYLALLEIQALSGPIPQ